MISRYEIIVRAICPVNLCVDCYDVTVESPHTIMVERLIDFALSCADKKETQEDITAALAKEFGCKVTSVGYHSGVKTTVVA